MLHPFAGVVSSNQQPITANAAGQPPCASRRAALGVIAGVATVATTGGVQAAQPAAEQTTLQGRKASYALYFVQPRQLRTFTQQQRAALGVHGPYRGRWPEKHPLQDKRGYLAWLNPAQAAKVKAFAGVADVTPYAAEHVVEYAARADGQNILNVFLSPNSWRTLPPKGSYRPIAELVKQWDAAGNATFSVQPKTKIVKVHFRKGVDPQVIDAIKRSGQVHAISWTADAADGLVTTQALGEEGDTTKKLGEEGGPFPSTRALGEEGGPKPTTKAVGEEGGATTMALGEEGGPKPSTRALGEEGGPRPSTKALGEEGGGKITTFALGEEGGRER